ncbi:hypothetical protein SAMN02745196_01141 [Clostridium collagenovorans DSM 3089]|uniref:ABC-2 family transporter protein n=1 Tax=Clostridium collagenovorans DSM 3089 TaxID=1121306 RepID=A0A1M5V738_9CLOT|nr:hypothetical protein [Clostridium collagenovorans]SHH70958.1 hypothetical protein SAMN02745196_01141 [Clostridium collagenovorans DSM 3089]
MKNIIKLELNKALKNKFFYIAIAIGFMATMMNFLYNLETFNNDLRMLKEAEIAMNAVYNPMVRSSTIFNNWVLGETHTLGSVIFFFILPILAAIPYTWSYCSERNSGYVKNMIIRSGKREYYTAKYIAVFVSGGLAVLIPLVLNFLLASMFFPASVPDSQYYIYYAISGNSLLSGLFYTKPLIYVFIFLIMNFLFSGVIACISFIVARFIKTKVAVILSPFFLVLAVDYFKRIPEAFIKVELSPMQFVKGMKFGYDSKLGVIIAEFIFLFIVTYTFFAITRSKKDVY